MSEQKKVSILTMIGGLVGGILAAVGIKLATDPNARKKVQEKFDEAKKKLGPKAEVALQDAASIESELENRAQDAAQEVKKKVSYLKKTAVSTSGKRTPSRKKK